VALVAEYSLPQGLSAQPVLRQASGTGKASVPKRARHPASTPDPTEPQEAALAPSRRLAGRPSTDLRLAATPEAAPADWAESSHTDWPDGDACRHKPMAV